ncbi:hypothetical protein [Agromyces archimandritae]|uniref:Chromosome condensation regulator RCC1 n=1 Tax=Agromyces archimandritae TaxID=2781962 RepID=A0A975IP19_9MICO|nr:hypothetical protein [Agromyces archimandritae]QTX03501.1 hypothetical protein G127AT_09020 [Agromyces archimandritae]
MIAAASVTPTAAEYTDTSHARTDSIVAHAANAVPEAAPGLSTTSHLTRTGIGLSTTGTVYWWGGLDQDGGLLIASPRELLAGPLVPFRSVAEVSQVSAGRFGFNALASDGTVWGWGAEHAHDGTETVGVLAEAARTNCGVGAFLAIPCPRQVRIGTAWNGSGALLTNILSISSTAAAGAGIREDGTIWHWGASSDGGSSGAGAAQLGGLPDPSVAGKPVYLKGAASTFFTILENGDVYYWGGAEGTSSLPPGTANAASTATYLAELAPWMKGNVEPGDPYIVAVDGGQNMGAALLSDGQVLSWSRTSADRTGRGAPLTPALTGLSGITSMQFSSTGVALLDSNGTLWGYGAPGDAGELSTLPSVVDTDVVQFISSGAFYAWQKRDGTFWGRGDNVNAALGPMPSLSPGTNRQISIPRTDWALEMLTR